MIALQRPLSGLSARTVTAVPFLVEFLLVGNSEISRAQAGTNELLSTVELKANKEELIYGFDDR